MTKVPARLNKWMQRNKITHIICFFSLKTGIFHCMAGWWGWGIRVRGNVQREKHVIRIYFFNKQRKSCWGTEGWHVRIRNIFYLGTEGVLWLVEISTTGVLSTPGWMKAFSKKPAANSFQTNRQSKQLSKTAPWWILPALVRLFSQRLSFFLALRECWRKKGAHPGAVSRCILLFWTSSWKMSIFSRLL